MKTKNKKRLFQRIQSRIGKFLRISVIISVAAFFAGIYSLNPALAVSCPAGQQDFDHNGTCESVCNENLKFSPPAMTSPLVINVTDVSNLNFPRSGDPQTNSSGGGVFPPNLDVIINMPTSQNITQPVIVKGGRNVRIVGGTWNLQSGDVNLVIDSPSKSIFIEGSHLNSGDTSKNLYPDIIVLRNNLGNAYDVYFQNVLIDYALYQGVTDANHVDGIQNQCTGVMGSFNAENVSVTSSDQGIFLGGAAGNYFKSVNLRNVDLQYGAAPWATGALLWLSYSAPSPSGSMENVYLTNLPSEPNWPWYEISLWPKEDGYTDGGVTYPFNGWGTIVSSDGKSVTFPAVDNITGSVKLGPPSAGSFVQASDVGSNFRSKWDANCGTTPPPTPPPTTVTGDLNGDGAVNATDFSVIKTDFLKLTASLTNPKSDIDADGQCTIKDIGILMSAWK